MIAIGIDVGGTRTRVGVVESDGDLLAIHSVATRDVIECGDLADRLARLVRGIRAASGDSRDTAAPIGLAFPGILDRDRRMVTRSVNLPATEHVPIADHLEEMSGRAVRLVTDAEAATWGEYTAWVHDDYRSRAMGQVPAHLVSSPRAAGFSPRDASSLDGEPDGTIKHSAEMSNAIRQNMPAPSAWAWHPARPVSHPRAAGFSPRDSSSRDEACSAADRADENESRPRYPLGKFLHLRIGTGVACGVVSEGKLLRLEAGRQGHLDALIIDESPDGVECPCGKRGCLELFTSGKALETAATRAGYGPDLANLNRAWERADIAAGNIVDRAADALARGLTNLASRFAPQVICLGGGVISAMPCLAAETARLAVGAVGMPSHEYGSDLERLSLSHSGSNAVHTSLGMEESRRLKPAARSTETVNALISAHRGDEAGVIGAALLAADRSALTP